MAPQKNLKILLSLAILTFSGFWIRGHKVALVEASRIEQLGTLFQQAVLDVRQKNYSTADTLLDELIEQSPRPSLKANAGYLKYQIQISQQKFMPALETLRSLRPYGVQSDFFLNAMDEGLILSKQLPGLSEGTYSIFEFLSREAEAYMFQHWFIARRVSDHFHYDFKHTRRSATVK